MYFLYILFAILIFGFLITIHELGHFLAAKLFGVKVNEFSICMGPAIWKRQKGETLYALRCIPVGGYCAMEGEDGDSDDPRSFGSAAWWKKLIILAAGAFMNFVTGVLILVLILGLSPMESKTATTQIAEIWEGSAIGGEAGLQAGDRIYSIDGERIYTTSDITLFLDSLNFSGAEEHDLVVIRSGQKVRLDGFRMEKREFETGYGKEMKYGMTFVESPRTLGTVLRDAWLNAVDDVRSVRLSLQLLFRGQASVKEFTGPVGIVKMVADVGTQSSSLRSGVERVMYLASFIAVNLAVMNLLPIPALDGGRIVGVLLTSGIEGITKKKLNPKIEGYIHGAGMILLLALMALIMLKDVIQIFR